MQLACTPSRLTSFVFASHNIGISRIHDAVIKLTYMLSYFATDEVQIKPHQGHAREAVHS